MIANSNNFGYWIFGKDMLNVNLSNLKNKGITDLFLNFYAFETHGVDKVAKWIEEANNSNINIHIWMQAFYDGEWHNPVIENVSDKINEAKKYASINGVKGLHLDYVRYPGNAYQTEGSSEAITNFVEALKSELPTNIILSCAIMPESEDKKYYGQDIEALGKIVDFLVPMQYKGNYNQNENWLKSTTKLFGSKAKIWSGLQSYKSDNNTALLSESELLNDSKICLDNGSQGIIFFRYGLAPDIDVKSLYKETEIQKNEVTTITNDIKNYIEEAINKIILYFTSQQVQEKRNNQEESKNNQPIQIQKSDEKIITNNNIFKMANDIKTHIESGKSGLPYSLKYDNVEYIWEEMMYIMPYAINNINSDCVIPKLTKPSSPWKGDDINEQIKKDDFIKQASNIISFVKNNDNTIPNYVTTITSKKKVNSNLYTYCFAKVLVYYQNHDKTLPLQCLYNTSAINNGNTNIASKSVIASLSKKVKEYIEKNNAVPSEIDKYKKGEYTYLFAKTIVEPNKDFNRKDVQPAPNEFGDSISQNINKNDYTQLAKNLINFVDKNGVLPNYATWNNIRIKASLYEYAFARVVDYYYTNQQMPNYVTVNSGNSNTTNINNTTNTNTIKKYGRSSKTGCDNRGQNNGYFCAPHMIQEIIRNLTGIVIPQSKLASVMGTTSDGTGHSGIETCLVWINKTYNVNLSWEWKNFSDLGWSGIKSMLESINKDCGIHELYRNKWGHYTNFDTIYNNTIDVHNSLGSYCNGTCYCGYEENRSKSDAKNYINGINQKSVLIITRKS